MTLLRFFIVPSVVAQRAGVSGFQSRPSGGAFSILFTRYILHLHPAPVQLVNNHLLHLLLLLQRYHRRFMGAVDQVGERAVAHYPALLHQHRLQVIQPLRIGGYPGGYLDPRQPGSPGSSDVQIEEVQRQLAAIMLPRARLDGKDRRALARPSAAPGRYSGRARRAAGRAA